MKYSDKIKQSNKLIKAIYSLKDNESIYVTYGKDYNGKPRVFNIKAYESGTDGKMSYSIWDSLRGMNIEKIGRTTMKAYDYNMMTQKTTYTFPLYKMVLQNIPEGVDIRRYINEYINI